MPVIRCGTCDGTRLGPDGGACPDCDGRGSHELLGCPRQWVSSDVAEAINLCSWAEESKILPVAGGVLDQTPGFMQTLSLVRTETARIKCAGPSGDDED